MREYRFFVLGPVIVALAFIFDNPVLTVIQVLVGLVYTALGFIALWLKHHD